MRLNTRIDRLIRIDGQELDDVDEFIYLGSKVTEEGITSEYSKSRLKKTAVHFCY